jgi:hypothetical protein
MSETFNNIGKRILETTGSNSGMMIMFIFVFIISIYVAFQLYNIVIKTDLQTKVLLKDVLNVYSLDNTLNQVNLTSDDETITLPTLNNGMEYSFSYWMFLEKHEDSTNPKLVLTVGGNTLSTSDIIMYMDPNYNKMNLLFKTTNAATSSSGVSDSLKNIHNNSDCSFFKMQIPYVPISRWVNITIVVDDNYIQLFMDGELRQVIDTSETVESCGALSMKKLENNSNFYAGKALNSEKMNGYLSKLKFFNYALTIDHAKMVYKTGPVHQSILSKLGLPLYGIRNPFYRVDSSVDDNDAQNNE